MKNLILVIISVLWIQWDLKAQEIEVVKYPQLLQMIDNCEDEDLLIFNFWATWCKPCIEELPQFDDASRKHKNIKIFLVSLDDVEVLDKVRSFVAKKQLSPEVMLLDETDYNSFIDKVSPEWSGAIPATLIIDCKKNEKKLYEGEFKSNELESIITQYLLAQN